MKTTAGLPKISCLMVTANRPQLCKRALRCYLRQTYPNKEVVIVDDGAVDLSPVLADVPADEVRYVQLEKKPGNVLGALRNVSLWAATGDFLAQWDDDDWYHEDRLRRQAAVLMDGFDACTLSGTLMHLDTEEFIAHPYVGYLKEGVPGSIMHRRDDAIRYPEAPLGEDTTFLKAWRQRRYTMLPPSAVHLFIRCFHGGNSWDQAHFLTRIRNTLPDLASYLWYRYVRQDVLLHSRFRLTPQARQAFQTYLQDSYDLNLLSHSVS